MRILIPESRITILNYLYVVSKDLMVANKELNRTLKKGNASEERRHLFQWELVRMVIVATETQSENFHNATVAVDDVQFSLCCLHEIITVTRLI